MRHSFSFAVTLHRVFDSMPPKAEASFYSGNHQISPVQKPNGLYVFLHDTANPLTIVCKGFTHASVNVEKGKVTPVVLYPDQYFATPPGWRLIHGNGESDRLLYVIDDRYEPKLLEHSVEQGFVRIRSRKGFAGGCLLFEAGSQKEIALILEKQSPDIFYISKLERDYTNGALRRIYCTRTDTDGEFYLVVPEEFSCKPTDYLYL